MARILALFAVIAVALAVVLAPSFNSSGTAVAQGSGTGTKVCKAKTPEGKTKTWRCGKDQACCVNKMMGTYVCGLPGMGCL